MATNKFLDQDGLEYYTQTMLDLTKKDWAENDEDSTHYVEGRTHYIDGQGEYVTLDHNYIPDNGEGIGYTNQSMILTYDSNMNTQPSEYYANTYDTSIPMTKKQLDDLVKYALDGNQKCSIKLIINNNIVQSEFAIVKNDNSNYYEQQGISLTQPAYVYYLQPLISMPIQLTMCCFTTTREYADEYHYNVSSVTFFENDEDIITVNLRLQNLSEEINSFSIQCVSTHRILPKYLPDGGDGVGYITQENEIHKIDKKYLDIDTDLADLKRFAAASNNFGTQIPLIYPSINTHFLPDFGEGIGYTKNHVYVYNLLNNYNLNYTSSHLNWDKTKVYGTYRDPYVLMPRINQRIWISYNHKLYSILYVTNPDPSRISVGEVYYQDDALSVDFDGRPSIARRSLTDPMSDIMKSTTDEDTINCPVAINFYDGWGVQYCTPIDTFELTLYIDRSSDSQEIHTIAPKYLPTNGFGYTSNDKIQNIKQYTKDDFSLSVSYNKYFYTLTDTSTTVTNKSKIDIEINGITFKNLDIKKQRNEAVLQNNNMLNLSVYLTTSSTEDTVYLKLYVNYNGSQTLSNYHNTDKTFILNSLTVNLYETEQTVHKIDSKYLPTVSYNSLSDKPTIITDYTELTNIPGGYTIPGTLIGTATTIPYYSYTDLYNSENTMIVHTVVLDTDTINQYRSNSTQITLTPGYAASLMNILSRNATSSNGGLLLHDSNMAYIPNATTSSSANVNNYATIKIWQNTFSNYYVNSIKMYYMTSPTESVVVYNYTRQSGVDSNGYCTYTATLPSVTLTGSNASQYFIVLDYINTTKNVTEVDTSISGATNFVLGSQKNSYIRINDTYINVVIDKNEIINSIQYTPTFMPIRVDIQPITSTTIVKIDSKYLPEQQSLTYTTNADIDTLFPTE